jgi:flagellar biosynthesis protein FlhA
LGIVAILVVPLPPALLDALLALDIFGAALVLLLSVTVETPLEFSAFAPALLLATLFRLALDVSATRLILIHGATPGEVGAVIPAFGAFVVQGNLVVGIIVFIILVTIQFVVIATGSQRIAEVAARFTLDAMPGKQMAIDADLHAGALDSDAARHKREIVQREADFYGAMDGAGKFVKGDAIAAMAIVALNLVGGTVVGIAYHGMAPLEALDTFALLSIGNALVTTLPAFLISIAMGMMVTRVASDGALGADLAAQLFARPEMLRSAGGLMLVLAFVPALPHALFATLGLAAVAAAELARRRAQFARNREHEARAEAKRHAMRRPEVALGLVGVDAVAIDVGANLALLLSPPLCDALLDRVGDVRRALATEIGIVLPGVRLRDDLERDPDTYGIRVRDELVGEGRLDLARVLAVADEPILEAVGGEPTREPVYELPARWIAPQARDAAEDAGALVFDPISILGSHLAESARRNAAALLGRQELQTLLEHLRASVPTLVKEIGNDGVPLPVLQRAFGFLLRERIWPRDPIAAIEAMLESGSREPRELSETARRVLVPAQLRRRGLTVLEPLILDPDFERELTRMWAGGEGLPRPADAVALREAADAYLAGRPADPALVCCAALRPLLADFLDRSGPWLDVFGYAELPSGLQLQARGVVNRGRSLEGAPEASPSAVARSQLSPL